MPCQNLAENSGFSGVAVNAFADASGEENGEENEAEQQQQYEMFGYAPIGDCGDADNDSSDDSSGSTDGDADAEAASAEAAAGDEAESDNSGLDRLIQRQLAADELVPCGGDSMVVFSQPPPIDPASSLTAVWRGVRSAADLSESEAEQIRDCMRAVRLPASSMPEWAARLPEREWKDLLMRRLAEAASASGTHE